jgi:hypothetical protein
MAEFGYLLWLVFPVMMLLCMGACLVLGLRSVRRGKSRWCCPPGGAAPRENGPKGGGTVAGNP